MALYQELTTTTSNQFLTDLAAFAAANGWTVDYSGVYNTSYYRIHISKGAAHFDAYSESTLGGKFYGCTGYSSGSPPASQPGVSAVKDFYLVASIPLWLISTTGGLYAGMKTVSYFKWLALFIVSEKVGAWTDGHGLTVGITINSILPLMSDEAYSTNYAAQIYINGAWSGNKVIANGLAGNNYIASGHMAATAQPCKCNQAMLFLPLVLFLHSTVDTTKKYPIGFLPGVSLSNSGSLYLTGDTFTVGTDTYIILPSLSLTVGAGTINTDLLFKLGA